MLAPIRVGLMGDPADFGMPVKFMLTLCILCDEISSTKSYQYSLKLFLLNSDQLIIYLLVKNIRYYQMLSHYPNIYDSMIGLLLQDRENLLSDVTLQGLANSLPGSPFKLQIRKLLSTSFVFSYEFGWE